MAYSPLPLVALSLVAPFSCSLVSAANTTSGAVRGTGVCSLAPASGCEQYLNLDALLNNKNYYTSKDVTSTACVMIQTQEASSVKVVQRWENGMLDMYVYQAGDYDCAKAPVHVFEGLPIVGVVRGYNYYDTRECKYYGPCIENLVFTAVTKEGQATGEKFVLRPYTHIFSDDATCAVNVNGKTLRAWNTQTTNISITPSTSPTPSPTSSSTSPPPSSTHPQIPAPAPHADELGSTGLSNALGVIIGLILGGTLLLSCCVGLGVWLHHRREACLAPGRIPQHSKDAESIASRIENVNGGFSSGTSKARKDDEQVPVPPGGICVDVTQSMASLPLNNGAYRQPSNTKNVNMNQHTACAEWNQVAPPNRPLPVPGRANNSGVDNRISMLSASSMTSRDHHYERVSMVGNTAGPVVDVNDYESVVL